MKFATRIISHRPVSWAGVVLFVAVALWPPSAVTALASTAPHDPALAGAPALSAPILLADEEGWSWRSVLKPMEYLQGSRRNLVQAATVAMCIALYIIWWRRAV